MIRNFTTLAFLLLMVPMAVNAQTFVAGTHYDVLETQVRTRDSSKVEVVEVFWYGCSHCYSFEPFVKQWKKNKPDYVDFWASPAIWNATMKLHARAFYAAKALGVFEKLHEPLFTILVVERKRLSNEKEIENLFADYGVDREQFKKTFNSFSINSQVNQADARARSYKVTGTPEVIVNGKYRVSGRSAGGQAKMMEVVDFLINLERDNLVSN